MSRRSRAREIALQALFQEDLNPENSLGNLGAFLGARLQDDAQREFAKQRTERHATNTGGGSAEKMAARQPRYI